MTDEHDFVDEDGPPSLEDPTGKLPPALVKALNDPFDYALGLRDGHVIHFNEARLQIGGKWIHLIGFDEKIDMPGVDHYFPRGIERRIRDIIWGADAPDGS